MKQARQNPGAWCVWFASVLLTLSLIKNPLYQIIIMGASAVCLLSSDPGEDEAPAWSAFLKLGAAFFVLSLVYNILISHYGETVIASLPKVIPVFGGPLTAEAAVYGLVFGLTFMNGLIAFAVLNTRAGAAELINLLPRRMRSAATVVSITFNYIPATGEAAREIREAQEIRGMDYGPGVSGRVRRAGALITPLVIMGLEKSVGTAESMESRGYGNSGKSAPPRRKMPWTGYDILVALAGVVPAAAAAICAYSGLANLLFQPYPKLTAPGFTPWFGLVLCLFALPGVYRK